MSRSIKSCLRLCEEILSRKYGPEVNTVFKDCAQLLRWHQAIIDADAVDSGNQKEVFWKVRDRIVREFLERDKQEEAEGRFKPILIKELIPAEVFEALSILDDALTEAIEQNKIFYYSISFSIPWEKIQRWAHPVRFKVVETVKEAEEFMARSLEEREKELARKEKASLIIDRKIWTPPPSLKVSKGGDPSRSDGFGNVLGEK